jgi:hypothetical protein
MESYYGIASLYDGGASSLFDGIAVLVDFDFLPVLVGAKFFIIFCRCPCIGE